MLTALQSASSSLAECYSEINSKRSHNADFYRINPAAGSIFSPRPDVRFEVKRLSMLTSGALNSKSL